MSTPISEQKKRAFMPLWWVVRLVNAAWRYWLKLNPRILHVADVETGHQAKSVIAEPVRVKKKIYHTLRAPRAKVAELKPNRGRCKRILIVEKRMITPDQDSGSMRTDAILKVLRQLGCMVEFIPENLQCLQPYSGRLQEKAIHVWHAPSVESVQELFESRGRLYDFIILCRHAVAARHIETARKWAPQAKIVFDTVDLHYVREKRRAKLERTEERIKIAAETLRQELDVVRKSDVTLVVSPEERDELGRMVPEARVEVLSNIHDVPSEEIPSFAARQGLLFIGGFKHHPNVDAVQWFVHEVWPLIRLHLPEAVVDVVGSHMPDDLRKLEASGVRMRGFVEDLAPTLKAARISIAPLRYGAGVKGKVNQAMAWGIPVVATPVAVEGIPVRAGVDILVAKDASAFAEAVVQLYQDEALWTKLAEGGRENVRRNFSSNVAMKSLTSLLEMSSTEVCDPLAIEGKTMKPGPNDVQFTPSELGWERKEFKRKTVLAIGCTSDGLPLCAAGLGAKKVFACEMEDRVANDLNSVAGSKGLPILVLDKSHTELDPSIHSADIVIAWLVANLAALEIKSAIKQLATLTNETLYLKTRAGGKKADVSKETSLELTPVLRELKYYFEEVIISHSVSPEEGEDCPLIRASGIRPQGAVFSAIGNAKPLGIALTPATNAAILVESDTKLIVAKTMASKSRLAGLEACLLNRLFDELKASQPKCLIAPLKLGQEYRIDYRGRSFMAFPFVGGIPGERTVKGYMRLEDLVPAFIQVRRDLQKLSASLISDLQRAKFFVRTKSKRERGDGKAFIANDLKGLENSLEELLSLAATAGDVDFDALVHGDLQIVNLIFDHSNTVKCVDLDNMALATAYTDILMALAWQGATEEQFGEVCSRVAQEEARPLRPMDIAIAVRLLLGWRIAVEKFLHVHGVDRTVRKWEQGFRSLIHWGSDIGKSVCDSRLEALTIGGTESEIKFREDRGQFQANLAEVAAQADPRIGGLNSLVTARGEKIKRLTESLAHGDVEIATLNAIVAQQREEIAAIYASTTWKITAPLRLASKLLRKLTPKILRSGASLDAQADALSNRKRQSAK